MSRQGVVIALSTEERKFQYTFIWNIKFQILSTLANSQTNILLQNRAPENFAWSSKDRRCSNLFSITTQGQIQKNPLKLTSITVYIEAKLQAIPIIIAFPKISVKIRFLLIQTRYSTLKEMTEKVAHSRTNFRNPDITSHAKLKKPSTTDYRHQIVTGHLYYRVFLHLSKICWKQFSKQTNKELYLSWKMWP